MQYLETFFEKQAQIVATSFILGLIFGASYDIIRINHILCSLVSYRGGKRRMRRGIVPFLLVFFADLCWMLLVGAVFSVWVYRVNDGAFRWFIAFSAVAGFAVLHATLGRVAMLCAEAIAAFLRRVFDLLVVRPLRFLGRILIRCARTLWHLTGGRVLSAMKRQHAIRRTERMRRALRQDLSFGERGEIS